MRRPGGAFFSQAVPPNWPQVLGAVAATFGFTLTELDGLEIDELKFWNERANELHEREP